MREDATQRKAQNIAIIGFATNLKRDSGMDFSKVSKALPTPQSKPGSCVLDRLYGTG